MSKSAKDGIFDINELLQRCGEVTFAKGLALVKGNAVHHLHLEDDSVLARVEGTDRYHVQLISEEPVTCFCTCPAAEYQDVCKHAVAVAIQANLTPPELCNEKEVLYRYLHQLSQEELANALLGLLEKDDAQWNSWLTKALAHEDSIEPAQFESLVDEALPQVDIWGWGEAAGYFHDAEIQFEAIWQAMASLPDKDQWTLILYIIERLNLVLQRIDDSQGDRFGLERAIGEKMPLIFERLDWIEEEKARWMFDQLSNHEFDVFPSIEDDFQQVYCTNDKFLALCYEKLKEQSQCRDSRWERNRYAAPLLKAARQKEDWQEEAWIMAMVAENSLDYLAISKLCLEHDEVADAEDWMIKARKTASGERDSQECDRQEVAIREHEGDYTSAWKLANQIFLQSPSFREYQSLKLLRLRYSIVDKDFYQRVEQALKDAYQLPEQGFVFRQSDDLLEFYLDQKRLDTACQWVEEHPVGSRILLELANEVAGEKPETALSYYLKVVAETIEQTNNGAYDQAIRYLKSIEKRLVTHPETLSRFYHQVGSLAVTYKRKRNMLKLFKKHYAKYV